MEKLKQYYFLLIPLSFILLIGLSYYYMPNFFPDLLNISKHNEWFDLFSLMISSLIALIGLYVAITLVAYSYFREKTGLDMRNTISINSINNYFVSYTIFSILTIFIIGIFVKEQEPTNEIVSLIYFSIFLFLSIILLIIPVAFNLFISFSPEKLGFKEVSKINRATIKIKSGRLKLDQIAGNYENDHLLKTQNIVIALVSVSENIKAQLILYSLTCKMGKLITQETIDREKKHIIKRYVDFQFNVIDFILSHPSKASLLNFTWQLTYQLYHILIEKGISSVRLKEFRISFFERFINRLFEHNKTEIILSGILELRKLLFDQVSNNLPDEDKILGLNNLKYDTIPGYTFPDNYGAKEYAIQEHWEEVSSELINIFSYVLRKGIEYNKPEIINEVFFELNILTNKIRRDKIGKYIDVYFSIYTSRTISEYSYFAFKKNVFDEGSDAKNLLVPTFEILIEQEHLAARSILGNYCNLLIKLQKINKLDYWFLGGLTIGGAIVLEGDLGHLARRFSYQYNKNKTIRNCLSDIVNTYLRLKDNFEKKPNNDFHFYIEIKERLETILNILTKEKVGEPKLLELLKKEVTLFKDTDSYEMK